MERVLVTGGTGRSGRWIVDRLATEYAAVRCVDRRNESSERANVDVRVADLTVRGDVHDLVGEFRPDAVVHWAAIPDPTKHAGGRVFENNVVSTYNVLDAAGRAGADVVLASSESTLGFAFADHTAPPDFVPVTEAHPLRPEDPYATSKLVAEEVAASIARRDGIAVTSIRPSWIQYPGEYACRDVDPYEGGTGNFWSYVDVRDVADLVAAALEAPVEGHEPFLAVAADNYAGEPTAELLAHHFGEPPDECDLAGDESAISSVKAATTFDWAPTRSWKDAEDAEVDGPRL